VLVYDEDALYIGVHCYDSEPKRILATQMSRDARLFSDDNIEILYGEEKTKIGHIAGYSKSEKTTYILRVKDGSADALLNVRVKSVKAGTASKEILVK